MSSVLKAQKRNAKKAEEKAKGKRKADDMDVDEEETSVPQTKRLRNKQRVLLLSSRGINHRMRHLMNDIEVLLPHTKKGLYSSRPVVRFQTYSYALQTPSWTQSLNYTSFPSLLTYITATTRFISRLAVMKIFISGQQKHRMDRASRCTFKTSTRWTSSS